MALSNEKTIEKPKIKEVKKEVRFLDEKINQERDKFWYEDLSVLFRTDRLTELYPSPDMTVNEKWNALTRSSIIIGIILFFITKNYLYIFIGIIGAGLTFSIWRNDKDREMFKTNIDKVLDKEYKVERDVVYPTIDNPFMNPLMTDYLDNPNRIAASSLNNYNNSGLKEKITEDLYFNLYRDIDDVFEKENSQRQFYTVPATTIPNDQTKFAKWLYLRPPTCREGNGLSCVANNMDQLKGSSTYRDGLVYDIYAV
jgi:hypothetical protein